MKITDQTIEKILSYYGIREPVISRNTLVDIDQPYQQTRAVKLYIRLGLPSGPVVLKLLRLPMCSDDTPERQSVLSEAFRTHGLPTPECLPLVSGTPGSLYVTSICIDGLDYLVKLEADAGAAVAVPDEPLATVLGGLLGKMHRISEREQLSVGPGAFYREFSERNTAYDLLWSRCGTDFLPTEALNRIRELYCQRMAILREGFPTLPRFAVQGDLYYMNLTKSGAEYRVIDYDRMGNEALLTDLVITWHRFWFDPHVFAPERGTAADRIQREHRLWELFYSAYCEQRKLTEPEYALSTCAYQLLGSVYGTRMLAAAAYAGQKELAASLLPEVESILTRPCSFAR